MLYSAHKVLTLYNGILEDGAFRVVDNRITDVGKRDLLRRKFPSEEESHFPRTVLLPGLINAHTHLEDGGLRNALPYGSSFTLWYEECRRRQAALSPAETLNAVHLGALEALRSGTTLVLDTCWSGASFQVLFNERLRSIIFLEVTGDPLPGPDDKAGLNPFDRALLNAQGFLSNALSSWGVAPQSPFALPQPFFDRCCRYASEQHVPVSCHAAESDEEWELFTEGRGRLRDYLAERRIIPLERHADGPVASLLRLDLVPERMILVHANYVTESTLMQLSKKQVSVVLCPRCHFRFQHRRFPLLACLAHGVNLCLGSESLAASESLDMFEELYCLKRMAPELSNETLLSLCITGGARAAGLAGSLGQIRPGFLADVIGVQLSHECGSDVLEDLLTEDHDIRLVLVDGKEVIA